MVQGTNPTPTLPAWYGWLLPSRPTMTHFLFGAIFLVLPVAARGVGVDWIIPAMCLSAIMGGGLGLGWLLAVGPLWLRVAPVTSICVLLMNLGCLGHLYLMPRLEVVLRAEQAIADADHYLDQIAAGESPPLPTYDAGTTRRHFRHVDAPDPRTQDVVLYTPDALQRWSLFGYRDGCYLAIYGDGRGKMLTSAPQLHAALAASP